MTSPVVSIVMAVYNGEKFLNAAIESVLNQDFKDFEFVIINDGSKDSSPAIIEKYAAGDSRIRVHTQENKGLIASLNTGLEISRAPLIARMDADDICSPDRLTKQVAYMNANPDVGVLGGAITLIDDKDAVIRSATYPRRGKDMDEFIHRGSPVAHPAVMMRRDLALSVGGYRKAYKDGEDYDLWLRLYEKAAIDNLLDIVLLYRQHEDKLSFKFAHEQAMSTIVARLASRQRRLGKHDPTADLDRLDTSVLDLFDLPQDERERLHLEMLEVTANSLALVRGAPALDQAMADLVAMSGQHNDIRARILLRAARGYGREKLWGKAFTCLGKSIACSPQTVIGMVAGQAKAVLKRRFAV